MTLETLRHRIGVDLGNKRPIEEGVDWAVENKIFYFDFKINDNPNHINSFDLARCNSIREVCEENGIHLGIHTESAVNIAETTPLIADAADLYLKAYVEN